MGVTTYALYHDDYTLILFANLFFCAFWALSNPTTDALLADSIEPGTRSRVYTLKVMVLQIARAFGPRLSIFLFFYYGNTLDIETCRIVMYAGLTLFIVPLTLLLLIFPSSFDNYQSNVSDASAYDKLNVVDTSSVHGVDNAKADEVGIVLGVVESVVHSPVNATLGTSIQKPISSSDFMRESDITSGGYPLYCKISCCTNLLYIPSMIAGSDVIIGLASGMTVKFPPIFLLFVLDLKPIDVQIIYLLTPFAIAANAPNLQELSKKHGRITVTCIVICQGVLLLLLLSFLTLETTDNAETFPPESIPHGHASSVADGDGQGRNPGMWTWVIIVAYLVRTALMNSTKPLTKSVLMDFVPKSQRGRWQSLKSVNAATWSGSAVVGGYLIDRFGFAKGIFATTAVLQGITILPLLRIRHLVNLEGDHAKVLK